MRRGIIFILLLLFSAEVSGKIKVVESSSKKVPVWYNGAAQESIITSSVSDISIDDAKRRAIEQIKMKIVESIAQNINSTTFSKIEQKSGDEDSFSDEFKSVILLNSAKLPFISGISENKIESYYWEVNEDSKTKKRNYVYSLKYPFSHADAEELIKRFEALDQEKSQELEMLDMGYAHVSSVEEIADALLKCEELKSYFFDATRKSAVSTLKAKYTSLYNSFTFVTKSEELGRAYVTLQIGDRPIATSQSLKANYDKAVIQNLQVVPRDGGFEISYDPQFCEDDLPYVITLNYTAGSRHLSHSVTFTKSRASKVRIQPQGVVTLTAQEISSSSLTNIQLNIDLMVEGVPQGTPISVDVVTLRVPTLKDELYTNKLSVKYVSDNQVSLMGLSSTTIALTGEKSGSTIKILTGEITGRYGADNKAFKSKFTLPYGCNW